MVDKMRRAVITGMGEITPLGRGVENNFKRMLAGESGIINIGPNWFPENMGGFFNLLLGEGFFPSTVVGKIQDDISQIEIPGIDEKMRKKMDICTQYALIAAYDAWKDSGTEDYIHENPERCGIIIGTGIGGITTTENYLHTLYMNLYDYDDCPKFTRMKPWELAMVIPNMICHPIKYMSGATGESFTVNSACASGTHSIGQAFKDIKLGIIDLCFCGGVEAPVTMIGSQGFGTTRAALSSKYNDQPEKASRPFAKDRDGFVLSEGTGIIIIEELENAKKRGAKIYAEILGYGASTDPGKSLTAPPADGCGIAQAMRQAIEMAKVSLKDIGYLNAHGTGTFAGDGPEIQGIINTFGAELASKIKVSSNKSMIGHCLGGAGGIEAINTIKTLKTDWICPTINLEEVAPDCQGVDHVINEAAFAPNLKIAMSNSLGFGGQNASLIFKKYEQ